VLTEPLFVREYLLMSTGVGLGGVCGMGSGVAVAKCGRVVRAGI